MKKVINDVSENNKGFSLLEVLVAVVLLAIIMTPLLSGFVTTARINKSSREYMGGIDVAESVLEGITNKTYKQLGDSIDQIEAGTSLVNEYCLSKICGDNDGDGVSDYNDADNFIVDTLATTNGFGNPANRVSDVTKTSLNYGGTVYSSSDLINSGIQRKITEDWTSYVVSDKNMGKDKFLTVWRDADKNSVFLCYTGINVDNRYFTVGISVLPCAHNDTDTYMSYSVYVHTLMYDVSKNQLIGTGDLTSGIRALQ